MKYIWISHFDSVVIFLPYLIRHLRHHILHTLAVNRVNGPRALVNRVKDPRALKVATAINRAKAVLRRVANLAKVLR